MNDYAGGGCPESWICWTNLRELGEICPVKRECWTNNMESVNICPVKVTKISIKVKQCN
ncbi:hypothetical protein MM300_10470 [Evansella sp. LMS18]|uniref:hypothetical protein n=1 Tax=Evansella sp. LMS18 TaxID=2924033 RepID=UPI0020CFEDB5|nr:hypothetical protein [Evansella sp. LMS18]UTR12659.1 hypothetical protein MM300_10470 [Evansella sp. LMS18]